jgi:hypothetical protein
MKSPVMPVNGNSVERLKLPISWWISSIVFAVGAAFSVGVVTTTLRNDIRHNAQIQTDGIKALRAEFQTFRADIIDREIFKDWSDDLRDMNTNIIRVPRLPRKTVYEPAGGNKVGNGE